MHSKRKRNHNHNRFRHHQQQPPAQPKKKEHHVLKGAASGSAIAGNAGKDAKIGAGVGAMGGDMRKVLADVADNYRKYKIVGLYYYPSTKSPRCCCHGHAICRRWHDTHPFDDKFFFWALD
jgi:hypothetical protein